MTSDWLVEIIQYILYDEWKSKYFIIDGRLNRLSCLLFVWVLLIGISWQSSLVLASGGRARAGRGGQTSNGQSRCGRVVVWRRTSRPGTNQITISTLLIWGSDKTFYLQDDEEKEDSAILFEHLFVPRSWFVKASCARLLLGEFSRWKMSPTRVFRLLVCGSGCDKVRGWYTAL